MNRTEKRQAARDRTKKMGIAMAANNEHRMRFRHKKAQGKKVPKWVEIV